MGTRVVVARSTWPKSQADDTRHIKCLPPRKHPPKRPQTTTWLLVIGPQQLKSAAEWPEHQLVILVGNFSPLLAPKTS